MTVRQIYRTVGCGDVFLAAPSAKGKLRTIAPAVPITAIHTVSIVASTMFERFEKSGGTIRFTRRPTSPKLLVIPLKLIPRKIHDHTNATRHATAKTNS